MTPETLPFAPPAGRAQAPVRPPKVAPDLAVAALPLLERAAELLRESAPAPSRWCAPAAHFFHGSKPKPASRPSDIADDLLCLMGSVEVRHAARAVLGLVEAVRVAADYCRSAARLLAALELVDDEVIRVRIPSTGSSVRVVVRGVPDFARFGELVRDRVGFACQFVHPRALSRAPGLRPGVASVGDWFWGEQPLARLPRVGGERPVLVVPATVAIAPSSSELRHVAAEVEWLDEVEVGARRAA